MFAVIDLVVMNKYNWKESEKKWLQTRGRRLVVEVKGKSTKQVDYICLVGHAVFSSSIINFRSRSFVVHVMSSLINQPLCASTCAQIFCYLFLPKTHKTPTDLYTRNLREVENVIYC